MIRSARRYGPFATLPSPRSVRGAEFVTGLLRQRKEPHGEVGTEPWAILQHPLTREAS